MCNDDTVNELKKDFHYTLSKFSHEIRNPLTLINSGLQMIASAHPEVEDYEHWDDVMDNLSYVRELLDELSAFNNAGRVKPEATDTGMYLKTVLSSVKPTLDYLDIRLVTDIPNDLPTLMLDRIQIRQMLLNLLKNAWEAVPVPGGQISVLSDQLFSGEGIEARPFVNGKYLLVGASLCGGRAYATLEKFFRRFMKRATGNDEPLYGLLEEMAREGKEQSDKMEVSTQFDGTRSNPDIRGGIKNLSEENFTPEGLTYGVLHGMIKELYDMYQIIYKATGIEVNHLVASGNGLRKNQVLQKISSEMFGAELSLAIYQEEAACGAAVSSAMGVV